MLDMKVIRSEAERVREAATKKGMPVDVDGLLQLDEEWRRCLHSLETMRSRRNTVSEEVGRRKKAGEDAAAMVEEMRGLNRQIKEEEERVRELESRIQEIAVWVPNIPHATVPIGSGAADNVEVRRWGEPRAFRFEPRPHWDLGQDLGILDLERAARIAGSRFVVNRGWGARLERALINFMLDLHVREHGYTEVFPPFLANRASMFTTGQIPKLEEDMFKVRENDYYLIPTAEVPLTNMHRDEIIDGDRLPLYYTAYSACFRAEAGAHGRDTRGIIRVHQFNKVELMKFSRPETSYDELEKLLADAEAVLQRLELPYRVVVLCTGDMSFASAKTYDIEVWLPSYGEFKEVSSCSNFEDFQARRGNIRYRPAPRAKAEYVHTLNGSGLAVGRTLAAILENYQQEDGTVTVPPALRPYVDGEEVIAPPA